MVAAPNNYRGDNGLASWLSLFDLKARTHLRYQ